MPADVINLNMEAPDLEKKLDFIEERQELTNANMERVIQALTGNPYTQSGGLVQEVKSIRTDMKVMQGDINELMRFKDRSYWTIALIALIWGVICSVIGLLFTYFSLKH